jgi:hypothetical protein
MKLMPHSTNYALVERAMQMRKVDLALRIAQPLLIDRDPSTQLFIGYLYEVGHLRGTGHAEWEWYRDAAEQGFVRAALSYHNQWGHQMSPWDHYDWARSDFVKSLGKIVREAAKDASWAMPYVMPSCSEEDCLTGLRLLEEAAEAENVEAQIILGLILSTRSACAHKSKRRGDVVCAGS